MPKAYSYLRFSTPEQAEGDSYRRQMAAALDWCKRKGVELDDKLRFHDLGKSGYTGANFTEGANSGNSSRNSTPLWARLASPGRMRTPPPTSAAIEAE